MHWLRKLDDRLFSPPHTFQTVLAFVVVRLGLEFDSAAEDANSVESSTAANSPEQRQMRGPT